MMYQETFETDTKEGISIKDITEGIKNAVKNSGFNAGICNIFLTATTSGLFINENERMLQEDIKKYLKLAADDTRIYHHPSNAASHIRANSIDKDLNVPIKEGELALGTRQSIFLVEFDKEPRNRKVIITILGE
jgi:secondary thiamine-phosphate synthase enzyme